MEDQSGVDIAWRSGVRLLDDGRVADSDKLKVQCTDLIGLDVVEERRDVNILAIPTI